MELIFYVVIFVVGVLAVAGFVQSLVYPPIEISQSELPDGIGHELNQYFPNFTVSQILFVRLRNRYLLNGTVDDRACRIKIDMTPDNDLTEVDFKDHSGPTAMQNKARILPTDIPLRIATVMNSYLDGDTTDFNSGRAYSGMIGSENAFEVKIRSEDYDYEFEITESGRLVEFEKESSRF